MKDKIKEREYQRQYRAIHREHIRARNRKWWAKNKSRLNKKHKEWANNNKDKGNERSRRWRLANAEKYHARRAKARLRNKTQDRKTYHRSYCKKRLSARWVLSKHISSRMRDSLRLGKNGRHWESLVGYTVTELKKHLELLFTEGMTWANMGKWHVDHIIPISFFVFNKPEDQEFQYCWSLNNLQPLWGRENVQKQDKINWRKHELNEVK